MPNVFRNRRENLAAYIQDTYAGNRAEFCRAIDKNQNLINLVLTGNPDYRRNIGEKLARDIEKRAGIAEGWLDSPRGTGVRKTTRIPIIPAQADIPDKAPLSSDFSVTLPTDDPSLALRSTGTANLAIIAVQEPSMSPTVKVGDWVWVDLGVKKIAGDGVYFVTISDGPILRRFQTLPTGDLRMSTDDPAYAPSILKGKPLQAMRVIGKAVACSRVSQL